MDLPFGSTKRNTSIFGSTESKPACGNSNIFGITERKSPFGVTNNSGMSENKPLFGNTSIPGSSGNKPLFGNTSIPGSSGNKPLFGNTSILGSSESKPLFGTSIPGSSGNKPLFGNTIVLGSSESKPLFGNSSISGSSGNKPLFGNTSILGSSESKPLFGNTSILGSSESKPLFGNTSISGSSGNKPLFENTSFLGSSESKPLFGNTSIFGTVESKPCFGSTDASSVGCTRPETQSPNFKTISIPTKMQDKPFGIDAHLFSLSSKTNKNYTKIWSNSVRGKNPFKSHSKVGLCPGNLNKTSTDAEEAAVRGGVENLSFSCFKPPSSQGGFILHNPDSEKHEEEIKKLVSNLQELIECPVCFGSLDSSLKQCANGHGICGSCSNNVEKCPTCQHAYLPQKPTLLLQVLDCLPKPCSFSDKGCDKIFFNTSQEEHKAFCKFRPTSCKFQLCEWKGTVEAVVDHVRTCERSSENPLCEIHFPNVKTEQILKFDKTQDASFYSAIIFENQLFWKYFHRDSSSKIISYKFYHIPHSKAKLKYYLVTSFSKGEIEFKMCVAACYEIEKLSVDQKGNAMSFFLPDEDLERFYDPEAKGYLYTQQIVVENVCDKKKSP